jgi:ankyrin repeat protein
MLAAIRGHITTVSALIAAGANVNAVNQDGYTALMAAASNGHTNHGNRTVDFYTVL